MSDRKMVDPHTATALGADVRTCPRRRSPGLAGLRLALRQATRQVHLRVEALFDPLDLTRRDGYAHFLHAHALALETVEAAVRADAPRLGHPPTLSELACADLRTLGAPLPEPGELGKPGDHDAFGMMYVVAGSHLGNRVLRERWRRSDDPVVRSAGAYLSSDRMSVYWPRFLTVLDARRDDVDTVEAAVDGAGFAFTLFEEAYRRAALALKAWPDV